MTMFILIILFLFILLITAIIKNNSNNTDNNNNLEQNKNDEYKYYISKHYIMTPTELKFYRELKKLTDETNMTIFSQVDLERIIQVENNESKYRNRIKSRSIDFVIVSNDNCKIICAIELDDYTHNYKTRIERDDFINNLFKKVNIPLLRIKVSNYYDMNNIKNQIEAFVNTNTSNMK